MIDEILKYNQEFVKEKKYDIMCTSGVKFTPGQF